LPATLNRCSNANPRGKSGCFSISYFRNAHGEHGESVATFRQPIDLLAETAAIAVRSNSGRGQFVEKRDLAGQRGFEPEATTVRRVSACGLGRGRHRRPSRRGGLHGLEAVEISWAPLFTSPDQWFRDSLGLRGEWRRGWRGSPDCSTLTSG
jgi:hypothetical protein